MNLPAVSKPATTIFLPLLFYGFYPQQTEAVMAVITTAYTGGKQG